MAIPVSELERLSNDELVQASRLEREVDDVLRTKIDGAKIRGELDLKHLHLFPVGTSARVTREVGRRFKAAGWNTKWDESDWRLVITNPGAE